MATASAVHLSTEEFTRAFLPSSHPDDIPFQCTSSSNPFASLKTANKISKDQISELLVSAIGNDLAPNLTPSRYKPHTDAASNASARNGSTAIFRSACLPPDDQPHWTNVSVPIEVYRSTVDPFGIPGPREHESILQSRQKLFDRISTVAEVLFAAQQRIFLFMLLVIGRRFRFLRWDRSGVIVIPAIDYYENPDSLCDILWRISLCSDTQLGVDPTATRLRPGDADYEKMSEVAKERADDVDEKERDLKPGELPDRDLVYKYVREMFSESVVSPWPRYRVEVPVGKDEKEEKDSKNDKDGKEDKDKKTTRQFLIAKPTFRARGMSGRGTRGYVALDCQTGNFMWLKDAWRAHYLLADKEGDILRRLNNAGVMNVPTLICHGDIQDQVTVTPDWWEAKNPLSSSQPQFHPHSSSFLSSSTSKTLSVLSPSRSRKRKYDNEGSEDSVPPPKGVGTGLVPFREDCPLRLHKHYRLVEKEVGMPLVKFQSGRQLVSVVLDCMYAHFQAATNPKLQILHRDISGGNILIVPSILEDENGSEIQWKGILTDWEMSKPKDCQTGLRQPGRTGTWQYLSVALSSAAKEVEICDELEAFFYVLLYYGVRYLPSNVADTGVGGWISSFFDACGVQGDSYVCGEPKLSAITTGTLIVSTSNNGSKFLQFDGPFDGIIKDLLVWFKAHRIVSKYESEKARLDSIRHLLPQAASVSASSSSTTSGTHRRRKPRPTDLGDTALGPGDASSARSAVEPSDEDRKFCEHVLTHTKMVGRLEKALEDDDPGSQWPVDDMVGDRVDKDFSSLRLAPSPTISATPASNKRRKMNTSMPLPTLRSQLLPPKTPERRRAGAPHHAVLFGGKTQH